MSQINLLFIFLAGFISAIPFAVFSEVSYIEYPPNSGRIVKESAFCRMTTDYDVIVPLLQFSSFVFFVLPMILITVLYIMIGATLKRPARVKSHTTQRPRTSKDGDCKIKNTQLAARKSIIKMLGKY